MVRDLNEMDPIVFRDHILETFKPPDGVSDIFAQWLDDMISRRMSFNSIYTYAQTVSDFLRRVGKHPTQVSESDIKAYSQYLTNAGKSPGTVLVSLIRIGSFLKYFDVKVNVYRYAPKKDKEVPEYLTKEELDRFLNAIDEDVVDDDEPNPHRAVLRFKALFTLLADTGLRATEACNLKKIDIDFRERLLTVRKGKGRKTRTVPVTIRALNMLNEYWKTRDDKLPYVFEYKGRKLDRMVIWRFTKKIAHKAGIDVQTRTHGPSIYPHMFRHTFATLELKRLIREGSGRMDALLIIKEALGHADITTTMIYLTLLGEDIRDMMGR